MPGFLTLLAECYRLSLTFPNTLSGIHTALYKYLLNKRRQLKEMASARYQSVTPQAPTDPTPRYDADKGREYGDQGRTQDTDQGFTLLLPLLSLREVSSFFPGLLCGTFQRKKQKRPRTKQNITWPKMAEIREVFPLPTLPQIPTSLPWTKHTEKGRS